MESSINNAIIIANIYFAAGFVVNKKPSVLLIAGFTWLGISFIYFIKLFKENKK